MYLDMQNYQYAVDDEPLAVNEGYKNQKTSRPVFVGVNYKKEEIYIDSQGEAKMLLLLKIGADDPIYLQPKFYYGGNLFYIGDFKLYVNSKNTHCNLNLELTIDWKKVFNQRDFENAVILWKINNDFNKKIKTGEMPVLTHKVHLYATNIFADKLKNNGEMINIMMSGGRVSFGGLKKRFFWLFKKVFDLSKTPIEIFDNGFVRKIYPWNFDYLHGTDHGSCFLATDGFGWYVLNYFKFLNKCYPDNYLDIFIAPTLAAYYNIARIQFNDEPSGEYQHFSGMRKFWLPKELRDFKIRKRVDLDGNETIFENQKSQFEKITSIEMQNRINDFIKGELQC